jgi:hypothetical protein
LQALERDTLSSALDANLRAGFFVLAWDGWKTQIDFNGAPLINFLVMLPDGGSVF